MVIACRKKQRSPYGSAPSSNAQRTEKNFESKQRVSSFVWLFCETGLANLAVTITPVEPMHFPSSFCIRFEPMISKSKTTSQFCTSPCSTSAFKRLPKSTPVWCSSVETGPYRPNGYFGNQVMDVIFDLKTAQVRAFLCVQTCSFTRLLNTVVEFQTFFCVIHEWGTIAIGNFTSHT